MTPEIEITLRLVVATVIGAVIGLNRDLHGKPTGVRTLGVVALGAALAVLAGAGFDPSVGLDANPVSRVIQGVLTGIGFLGAGVIIQGTEESRVQGLTTAAVIWLTACVGVVCGLGGWLAAVIATVLVFLLLSVGGRLERWLHDKWRRGRYPGGLGGP